MKKLILKTATGNELQTEIKRLKSKLRKWQQWYEWENMSKHYGVNAAQVNLGKKPELPEHE